MAIYYGSNNSESFDLSLYGQNWLIYGYGGNDYLIGSYLNDTIYGDEGDDTLAGGAGNDQLFGGVGNDTLIDTEGTIDGGTGTDTLVSDYSNSLYSGGIHLGHLGERTIRRRDTGAIVLTYTGIERFKITGTRFNDVLIGGTDNDSLNGGGGNDVLEGGGGNGDILNGGEGNDTLIDTEATIDGGTGTDTLVSDYSSSPYNAGVHLGYLGETTIRRRDTGAIVLSYTGIEIFNITGTRFDDVLVGAADGDTLNGGAGNDSLEGNGGNDSLSGGDGNDTLRGGAGRDTVNGGAGNDLIFDTEGTLDGGAGFDRLVANYGQSPYSAGVHLGFRREFGERTIRRRDTGDIVLDYKDIDAFEVTGTRYDDVLAGENGFDYFKGGAGNDLIYGGGGSDILIGEDGADTLYGERGDVLYGGVGNDTFYATEAASIEGGADIDTLVSDHSRSNYGIGITFDTNFAGKKTIRAGLDTLLTADSVDIFNLTGTRYADTLKSYDNEATLAGGAGDDRFEANRGRVSGGTGIDSLKVNYSLSAYNHGIHAGMNGESAIRQYSPTGAIGNTLLSYDGIERLQFTGTGYADILNGREGDDTLEGLAGNDSLDGGDGNDFLDGGIGSDTVRGGAGDDQLFDIFSNPGGVDILEGGEGNDYLYAVADIQGATKQLFGNRGADTFVLDLRGQVQLGFDFNVAKLGSFVNTITLPENQGPNWKRMGISLGFSVLGAAAGSMPYVGAAASFMTTVGQMGVDAYLNQQEVNDQIIGQMNKAFDAVKSYGTSDWGTIFQQGTRDVIRIKDFQPGLDNILLPRLPQKTPGQLQDPYEYDVAINLAPEGGVKLSVKEAGGISRTFAIIDNNFKDRGIDDAQFKALIADLIQYNTNEGSAMIGTFARTRKFTLNNSGPNTEKGTIAGDRIEGDSGCDILFGLYGDDAIQGGDGDDTLYGGHNNSQNLQALESTYGNDGDDILGGGGGNDILYGETGNDFLNGNAGNDSLYGGTGNDILTGEAGNDTLIGGTGSDRFLFNELPIEGQIDSIIDFSAGEFDKIMIGRSFGTNSRDGFSYDTGTAILSFNNQQLAILQGNPSFTVATDLVFA